MSTKSHFFCFDTIEGFTDCAERILDKRGEWLGDKAYFMFEMQDVLQVRVTQQFVMVCLLSKEIVEPLIFHHSTVLKIDYDDDGICIEFKEYTENGKQIIKYLSSVDPKRKNYGK